MIAILCPTRGRPEQCQRMIQSAYDTTTEKVQIFLAVSEEDFPTYQSKLSLPESDRVGVLIVTMPEATTCFKWNRLAQLAFGQPNTFYMLAADDMVFETKGWDKALIEHYNALPEGRKAHVYALRDSRDENGTPHIIVTREWIECMGYFVPPIFLHWFIDTWTVEIAKFNHCFTHMTNYVLRHDKPSDSGIVDATHSIIRERGWREVDAYTAHVCKDWLELQKAKLQNRIDNQQAMKVRIA